ncbi:uncharacterized protein LOC112694469 [Sipha flava]|uniref:Uncharacterized protein LOC112694469 n=1 Tax=Sipha flava TaxID=143950 RepID=A0A8B8GSV2_9HEMI|nr:uncharacterized protein LOC112694469 [Sipha flava]
MYLPLKIVEFATLLNTLHVIFALTTVEKPHATTRDGSTQTEWNFGRRDFGSQTAPKCSNVVVQTTDVGVQTTDGSIRTEIFTPVPYSVISVAVPPLEPVTSPTDPRTTEKPKINTLIATLKYWKRRYSLFSRFDEGVVLDEVSFLCAPKYSRHTWRQDARLTQSSTLFVVLVAMPYSSDVSPW